MNNFVIGLKRFFTNKNVVTVIGVILVLVILYFGYSSSIKKQTNPVSVPVAAKKINQQTKITSEDVIYVEVASSIVTENVVLSDADIVDKYTNINVTIPQGSMFFQEWLVEAEDLPGNWIENLDREKGELGYYMSVDIESTLGNSILPNTYIDIYMKADDENGTAMFGKLIKDIKVLAVHDDSGNNVFDDSEVIGTPAKIGFAVGQDSYNLLHKIEYLDVELIVQPRGSALPSDACKENCVVVASSTLRDFVDTQTITVEEDAIVEEETEEPSEEILEEEITEQEIIIPEVVE